MWLGIQERICKLPQRGVQQLCCHTLIWREFLVTAHFQSPLWNLSLTPPHNATSPPPLQNALGPRFQFCFDLMFTIPSLDPCVSTGARLLSGCWTHRVIVKASRQPRLVPKPERMASDGGESAGGGGWGESTTCSLLGDSTLDASPGLTQRDVSALDPHPRRHTWEGQGRRLWELEFPSSAAG